MNYIHIFFFFAIYIIFIHFKHFLFFFYLDTIKTTASSDRLEKATSRLVLDLVVGGGGRVGHRPPPLLERKGKKQHPRMQGKRTNLENFPSQERKQKQKSLLTSIITQEKIR